MNTEIKSTAPKPFIFVLMPFDKKFDDIYTYGIKGAADDANAYAERVDEQIFTEGILERIFNQISKADVIVADMTGRNQNVFYEVGYAHALGKIVLLLTQNADDIPFDLKHRQHIVYGGEIKTLQRQLTERLIWAIEESKRRNRQTISERFLVSISQKEIPEARFSRDIPVLKIENYSVLSVNIRNGSLEATPSITHIYLFASSDSKIWLYNGDVEFFGGNPEEYEIDPIESPTLDSTEGRTKQFRLTEGAKPITIPPLPPGAIEQFHIFLRAHEDDKLKIRIHSSTNFYDFPFKIELCRKPLPKGVSHAKIS